ncbi:hypothetical protein D9753_04370 [Streptomyces dangxiongensis]|uniref:DUF7144 domain-containing protein n=1 Tax=Streptomyces dangxiongensis TaxID=1442032 RepID=A0A3G2J821_9ACTN|nr:hypothetical protein [Streptomyces dangxiongensis]AYN38284.1 hypothetical protein D9753_04370 [Streptomyces dangxiongensis]
MTATHPTGAHTRSARQAWAGGLTSFAGVMLSIAGLLAVFRGIMAIAHDDVFVSTPNYVFKFNLTSWGWIHLILGVIAVIVGFGLLGRATWARVSGIVIAGLVIIANFLSLPYYPLWSIVLIALSGFIIWALCVVEDDDSAVSR